MLTFNLVSATPCRNQETGKWIIISDENKQVWSVFETNIKTDEGFLQKNSSENGCVIKNEEVIVKSGHCPYQEQHIALFYFYLVMRRYIET